MTDTYKKSILKVGLTGGIGSGKTYVSNIFKDLGIPTFNTDDVVKYDVIRREAVRKQMIAEFGEDSYLPDGSLNRDKFIKLLFDNPDQRSFVNRVVSAELRPMIEQWSNEQTSDYVLVECAVMFENGLHHFFDRIITVTSALPTKIRRLLKRGVERDNIDRVMNAQWSDEKKLAMSDWQLINDELINIRVTKLHQELVEIGKRYKL